jgi:hypothetical protein
MPIPRLPYVQHPGIDTHPGSVLTLAVTEDGAILASGGKHLSRATGYSPIFAQARKEPDFGTWLT